MWGPQSNLGPRAPNAVKTALRMTSLGGWIALCYQMVADNERSPSYRRSAANAGQLPNSWSFGALAALAGSQSSRGFEASVRKIQKG